MMIGLGTDIVNIERIAKAIATSENKFINRILSPQEQAIASGIKAQNIDKYHAYIAKRYAAKEATAKALGTGIGQYIEFTDVSTLNKKNGQPYITLTGQAAKTLAKLTQGKTARIDVSLSDEPPLAIATVIISHD